MNTPINNKVASSVSIIGGADGPTSFFILGGKNAKRTLKQQLQRKLFALRKQRIARHLKADPHTMEQVIEYAKSKWGYSEADKNSEEYKREYVELRASFILQHKPELLGEELREHPQLERRDEAGIRRFMELMEQRQEAAQDIPIELFDIDLCILEIDKGVWHSKLILEKNYGYIGASASGKSKRAIRRHGRMYRDIYRYYGVAQEDIDNRTKRYDEVLGTLARR